MHSGAEIPSRTLFTRTPTILMVTLLPMSISSFNLRDKTSMIRIPLLKTGGLWYEERLGRQPPYPLFSRRPPGRCDRSSDAVRREPACTPVAGMRTQQKTPVEETQFFEGAIVA
jgi:hypothetical protein